MRWFYRGLAPAVQLLHQDDDFRPREPGVVERFVGFWNGHPVYRERAPKAVFLRDPRAVANEEGRSRAQSSPRRGEYFGKAWRFRRALEERGVV
jgi:hypothetical protein